MTFLRDLRFGVRILVRNPSYAAAAIAVVALGIGATTAVFTVVRAVLLQPLPYRDVDRLVLFRAHAPGFDDQPVLTPDEFHAIQDRRDLFEDVATANESAASLTGVDDMERISSAMISDNFLPLFGVAPAAGRQVSSREDVGAEWIRAVDISYELWQRRWHGDPAIVGQTIEVNNLKMTIAGVMPRGFRLYMGGATGIVPRVDVWYPGAPDVGSARACPVVARLRSGMTLGAAQAAIDVFMPQFIAAHPSRYRTGPVRLTLSPLADDVVREVRPALLALAGAVGFVLLAACANLMNLLLARACSRTRELAVRKAIGASRSQIIAQLATEGLVLGVLGAAAGLLVAQWGVEGLLQLAPATLPRREDIGIDLSVAVFAVGLSVICSLVFSLVPAWHATRTDLAATMKPDAASSRGAGTTRGALVACQLAISLILLVGAGLMVRAFIGLRDVPLGFRPHGVVTMKVDLPPMRFKSVDQREAFYLQALAAIRQIPGVDEAGIGTPTPLSGEVISQKFSTGAGEPERVASAVAVLPGFAEVLGVPLRAGRLLSRDDRLRSEPALMVDERLAAEVWPGDNPVGKRVLLSPSSKTPQWGEVVGVVAHVQFEDLRHSAPQLWVPFRAMAWSMDVAVRTRRDPPEMGAIVKYAIERLDPGRPIYDVRPLDEYVADASADTRFALFVLGAFALLALVLTAIGVYGVVAYATARRMHEIAVRLALGADARTVVALVVRDGARWTVAGLVVGAIGARLLTRYVQTLLFHVGPNDAATFVGVALLLSVVALVATALPAIRAVRIDPMLALRSE